MSAQGRVSRHAANPGDSPELTLIGASPGMQSSSVRRLYIVAGPLFLLLLLWIYVFYAEGAFRGGPGGKAFGADWAMFMGGARTLQNGANPYDPDLLYRTEASLLRQQHLPITDKKAVVRVGNPPLFFWALQPLTDLPFQPVALASLLGLYLLSLVGCIAGLVRLGWKSFLIPTVFFMLMPQVVIGAFYGNIIGLVCAAIGLAVLLCRKYPFLAGVTMSVAWLKPPVALPIVGLIILFQTPRKRRAVVGLCAATATLLAATILLTGISSVGQWVHGMLGYSRDMSIQPDVASLAGLYVRWMPSPERLVVEALIIGVAATITGLHWYRVRDRAAVDFRRDSWLWCVWMLATPYAHFFDEILLVIPLLSLMGRDGREMRGLPATALYLSFFSLFLLSWTPGNAYLLPLPLAAITGCAFVLARRSERSTFLRVAA